MLSLLIIALAAGPPPLQGPPPALSVLPAGGGQSHVVDLCDLMANNGDLAGNYFCLRPDGGHISATTDGGVAMVLAATGSPVTLTRALCPNGPNCAVAATQQLDGGNRFATAAHGFAQDDFSAGCLVSFDDVPTTQVFLDHDNAGNEVFTMYLSSSAAFLGTRDGTAQTISNSAGTLVSRARHLVGFSFDYSGTGAVNSAIGYLDGVAGTEKTTMRPPLAATTSPTTISVRATSSLPAYGAYGNCFLTEALLTAGDWTALAGAALGELSGAFGETLTYTRASAAACEASDGTVATLPGGRPCVTRQGIQAEPSATFLALWPRDLSRAATWVPSNMTCTKTATGKDGAPNSASTCTATAGNGTAIQSITVASAARVTSLDVKRRTGTGNIDLTRNNGTAWATLSASNCFDPNGTGTAPNASTWVRCYVTSTLENPQIGIRLVTSGDAVDVDYFDDEAGAVPTSRCDNLGSTCTRAAPSATLTTPAVLSRTEGCASACLTPAFTGAAPASGVYLDAHGGSGYLLYVNGGEQSVQTYDGTNAPSVAVTYTTGVPVCVRSSWSATRNDLHAENLTTGAVGTSTAFTTFPALGATTRLGDASGGGSPALVRVSDVKLDSSPDGCR